MAGPERYAVVRERAFADPRVHRAGEALVKARLAVPETAPATVAGIVAALACRLLTDGDSGTFPEPGWPTVKVAAFCSHGAARGILAALLEADLVVQAQGGAYRLRGFDAAYERLLRERVRDRKRGYQRVGKDATPRAPRGHPAGPPRSPHVLPTEAVAVSGDSPLTLSEVDASGAGRESDPPTPRERGEGSSAPPEPGNGVPEAPDPLLEPVFDVHGRDPKTWPAGPLAWRREVLRVRAAGVEPGAWREAVAANPRAKPWEVGDVVVKAAEARREAEAATQASRADAEVQRRARMREKARVMAAWPAERVEAYFEREAASARGPGDLDILSDLRAEVEEARKGEP